MTRSGLLAIALALPVSFLMWLAFFLAVFG